MSTTISRLYNWVTDKANAVKITASRQDAELDQIIVALNRKVLCAGSAPSSPIAGQTWVDTTNKLLKLYRNNEWVIQGIVHVGTSAPATVQEGDLWYDTTNNLLKSYDGASWTSTTSIVTGYRNEMNVMQASTATITVGPGSIEVNGALVSKTENTTLTLSTAGHYASGSSQRATSTLGYVVIDASGNIKLTTTAPTHADYALSITAANNTKRYATISGTVYRYLGWFYMNATGSGELDTYGVSNILDMGVRNAVCFQTGAMATGSTAVPLDDTIPQSGEGDQFMSQVFRPTNVNNKIRIKVVVQGSASAQNEFAIALFQDATASALVAGHGAVAAPGVMGSGSLEFEMKAGTIVLTTFKVRCGSGGGTFTFNGLSGARLYGGVYASSISVEEIGSQLT